MTSILSQQQGKGVVLSEANGYASREAVVVTQAGAALESGTLLTQSGDAGAGAFAMDAGSTGNPTSGAITIGAAAKPGVYKLTFTAATKVDVDDPDGVRVGTATLGAAFNKGGLTFTLTAGATPAVAGDGAAITVAAGTLKYVPYTAAGAAGPADAILLGGLKAATGDTKALGLVRNCEVNRYELVGLDTAGASDLAKRGILVRGNAGAPTVSTPAL